MNELNRGNPYLQDELRRCMELGLETEIFVKATGAVRIAGTVIAVNVNDRTPTVTLCSVHKGRTKTNIITLSSIATINIMEETA